MKRRYLTTLLILTLSVINLPFLPINPITRIPVEAKIRSKISPAINSAVSSSNGKANVIVMTNSRPSMELKNQVTRSGGRLTKEFKFLNGFACELPQQAMEGLARSQEVRTIQPDSKTYPLMDITAAATGADVAQQNYGWDGSGVGVAVIDSGINKIEDLSTAPGQTTSRVVYSESFIPGDPSTADAYGHGTHVAGIIAGNGSASMGGYRSMQGIAPKANLINLRVLDQNGAGSVSSAISAIEAAINLQFTYNIRSSTCRLVLLFLLLTLMIRSAWPLIGPGEKGWWL
jgi:serine protease AprX